MRQKLILVSILLAIILVCFAGYYFIPSFHSPAAPTAPSPSPVLTPSQTAFCQQNQLSASISSEGAAGSIYATLELTNTGKTACEITLGNTITAMFDAKNIATHYIQETQEENFMLDPSAKVYSQIHYPNGPQCQSGIVPKPITFLYKTNGTSVAFVPTQPNGKLEVQACATDAEKTTIDIWPLSKTPITQ